MTKEALQLALEALTDFDYDKRMKAIEIIKETLETKEEPFEYWTAVEGWVKINEVREHFESVSCGTIYKNEGEGRVPLYTTPQRKPLTLGQKQRLWSSVGDKLTLKDRVNAYGFAIEAAHGIIKEKNT